MITDLGSLTLAAVVPAAAAAAVAINVSCGIAAPNVSAQLTALLSFSATVSLSLAAQLDLVAAITANLQAAITLGLTPPTLSAQLDAAIALKLTLEGFLLSIQAQLAIAVALQALLATGGVRLLKYSGPQNTFDTELGTALGSSSASCNALVLLTTTSASWTAVQGVFKTS